LLRGDRMRDARVVCVVCARVSQRERDGDSQPPASRLHFSLCVCECVRARAEQYQVCCCKVLRVQWCQKYAVLVLFVCLLW
jgi:hypothetical protein